MLKPILMKIKDLDGEEITVSDLDLAIMQADDYRHITTIDPEQLAFAIQRQAYWEDIYQKLLNLKR